MVLHFDTMSPSIYPIRNAILLPPDPVILGWKEYVAESPGDRSWAETAWNAILRFAMEDFVLPELQMFKVPSG